MAWENSLVFSQAICLFPAFQFENENFAVKVDLVATVRLSPLPVPLPRVAIVNGGVGLDAILRAGVDVMRAVLLDKGMREDRDVFFRIDPSGRQDEATWADQMEKVMKRPFGPR